MNTRSALLLLLLGLLHLAYAEHVPKLRLLRVWSSVSHLRGGAPDPVQNSRFYTWGDSVHRWDSGRAQRIATAPNGFDEGGCALDLDRNGRTGLVLARRSPEGPLGDLIFYRAPTFLPEIIDTNVELHDCLSATLSGRSGFLMIHRHAQVRFYWRTDEGKWKVEEIYSIYTASRQSGLALADVDGDNRVDIYAGNYWVRAPARADLPWHIFAIHLHNESDEAASFSYAAWPDLLVGAQRHRPRTPVRLFHRPSNARELWPETALGFVRLDYPSVGLAWGPWALFGHNGGLFIADPRSGSHQTYSSPPVLALWTAKDRIFALSGRQIAIWALAGKHHPRQANRREPARIGRKPLNLLALPPGVADETESASPPPR